jgi:hypothetical protein
MYTNVAVVLGGLTNVPHKAVASKEGFGSALALVEIVAEDTEHVVNP